MESIQIKPWPFVQSVAALLIAVGIIITLWYVVNVTPTLDVIHVAPVFDKLPHTNLLILYVHIATAVPPLALGLVTFSARIRKFYPKIHRYTGTLYCACVWCSSILGMLLASANKLGVIAQFGFGTLAFMWFFTTTMAYINARNKQFSQHRQWMIRSFELTLAVVSVRPMFWWPPSFIDFYDWYLIATWLCWVPNLIIAEIYVRCTTTTGKYNKSFFTSNIFKSDIGHSRQN
ncbi:MAG: DUF2306 domain-containing protein [Gammaproteobacteria bacterium]|nr:DUF2306 domain-containing protein [Gammaproteobacteria bacterium]